MEAMEAAINNAIEKFALPQLKKEQREVVEDIIRGKDVVGVFPTGYGKSICFYLPPVVKNLLEPWKTHLAVVVSPLRSLVLNQLNVLRQKGFKCANLADIGDDIKTDVLEGNLDILFSSPEALITDFGRGLLTSRPYQEHVCVLAFDEAHCIIEWGDDFRPAYKEVSVVRSWLSGAPVLLLSATISKEMISKILTNMMLSQREVETVAVVPDRMSYSKPLNENCHGRKFVNGRSSSNDLRHLIVVTLIEKGGDVVTGTIQRGVITEVAQQLKVARSTVNKIWNQYCCYGSVDPLPHAGGKQCKLSDQEIQYLEFLKRERPSVSYKEMKQKLEQNASLTVSVPTLSRTVTSRFSGAEWTYKKLVRTAKERFTVPNLRYTQAFVDVLHQRNPYKLIFFDEAGFKLPDVGNPTHGHAPSGERAVEIQSRSQTRNMTLNLAVGLLGLHADVVCGASNTQNYLEFWDDAATYGENFDGTAFLSAGSTVVVDNCATHRNAGGRALSHFLQNIGVEYVYTPSYSPDMNVAEFVFGKLKRLMQEEPYRTMCRENMENAIFNVLSEITASDIRGFFLKVGYLNI